MHQVVLDPAKMRDNLIRIGDWPGDEATGWQYIGNIFIVIILGIAERVSEREVKVTPIG